MVIPNVNGTAKDHPLAYRKKKYFFIYIVI